jgi:DNA-binding YbaB/EbfC family protein
MFKQLQGLQSRVGEIQEKLKSVHVTGSAGGGMVTVDMNGQMQVEKIIIAPEAVDPTDAMDRLKEKIRDEVSQATGMLGLPPGFLGF